MTETVLDLIHARASARPDAIAIEHRGQTVSFAELRRHGEAVAAALRSAGMVAGEVVAVLVEEPVGRLMGLFGVLEAGGAFMPLDPGYPARRLAAMTQVAQPSWLLTAIAERHDVQAVLGRPHSSEAMPVVAGPPLEITDLRVEGKPGINPPDLAYVYFTSGSTGEPRAIAGSHKGLLHFIQWEIAAFGLDASCRGSQLTPVSFDPFLRDVFVPLGAGGTLCIPDSREAVRDLGSLLRWLAEARVTLMHSVPTLFRALIDEPTAREGFAALRHVLIAGEPLYGTDVKKWAQRVGNEAQLVNLYGPTETTLAKFFHRIQPADAGRQRIPVGRPIEGAAVLVLDTRGQPCPAGLLGEIHIRTAYRSLGYYRRPDLTEQAFVRNPFGDDATDVLYKTGDLGRLLEDGSLELAGRKDHQVKVRGVRVELGEVEQALRAHPEVDDVAVKDWEDRNRDRYLCAYVVGPAGLRPGALREFLQESLPDALIPSSFVPIEALPLSLNGKVDRRALPPPEKLARRPAGPRVAPRDVLELQLARMWEELLGVPSVAVGDNFFDLGGHSMLAVRLFAEIKRRWGRDVPLGALLAAPTVELLAGVLREDAGWPASSLVPIRTAGTRRPFFCVHPGGGTVLCYQGLAAALGADQPFYGLQSRGLQAGETPLTSVAAMAAHYAENLRAIQPEGPYAVGGWSLGGAVAFELARQLRQSGHAVSLVALFDAAAPAPGEEDDATLLAGMFDEDLPLSVERLRALGPEERIAYVLDEAKRANVVPPSVGLAEATRVMEVCKTNVRALHAYLPGAQSGRVVLFRALDGSTPSTPGLGWEPFILPAGSLEVRDVPGNHTSLLREPHVRELAAQLRQCLDESVAGPAPPVEGEDHTSEPERVLAGAA